MLREVKTLTYGHTANRQQSWDSNAGLSSYKSHTSHTTAPRHPCTPSTWSCSTESGYLEPDQLMRAEISREGRGPMFQV